MAEFAYTEPLRVLSADASADLGQLLASACAPPCDPVVSLADYSRQFLYPLTAGLPGENVEGTLHGRAFTTGEPAVSARDGHARGWVPVRKPTARGGAAPTAAAPCRRPGSGPCGRRGAPTCPARWSPRFSSRPTTSPATPTT